MSTVRYIHSTPEAEKHMGYCARVSNPSNQENPDYEKLLAYCIKNQHWSVFEMATLCLEITTSRGISPQILRHRSFNFQEFSQRYASPTDFVVYEARRQDSKNRQNSLDDLDAETKSWFVDQQRRSWEQAKRVYDEATAKGIAKECARFLLPASTETKIYMHGTVRSWIHYIQLRTTPGTQREHRDIAFGCKVHFCEQFPTVARALEWQQQEASRKDAEGERNE